MATVALSFSALPAHVRTARLVAASVARRSGLDTDLLDEVRLAVAEACSRAVDLHQRHAPDAPVKVEISDDRARFTITVTDAGPPDAAAAGTDVLQRAEEYAAGDPEDDPLPAGFGLAVIAGLVDSVDVTPAETGTSVRMSWPL